MLLAYRPFSAANFSKAAVLYQPAVPGLLFVAGALEEHAEGGGAEPKAAVMRAARP